MNKEEIIKRIKILSAEYYKKNSGDGPSLIEKLIKNYLEEHQRNTQMWLRLAMLYYSPYFSEYPPDIFFCLSEILKYDSSNIYANIMMAFFHDAFYGIIPDEIFQKINALKTNKLEDLAMIEIIKAWYFRNKKDDVQYKNCLQKAIMLDPEISKPYVLLGRLYLDQGKFALAKEYLEKGLKKVISPNVENSTEDDMTSYEDFFNYFFRGTHLTTPVYESIADDLKKVKSKK